MSKRSWVAPIARGRYAFVVPHVALQNISKSFGETPVLNSLSIEIEDGEFFFLLGPSGCGKSTLLRIIAGLESPDCGDVLFAGKSVLTIPPHLRNIGMVFQQYALWPHMTVADNVGYGLRVRKTDSTVREERITNALRMVQMESLGNRYPSELSGGQQQRVALARALAFEPDMLLLDEPLSNLDAKLRVEVREEIREVRRKFKRTMIYVTHDQEDALRLADRVAVINGGRICQIGTPEELYYRPASLFVATFIGSANVLSGTFEGTATTGSVKIDHGEGESQRLQVTQVPDDVQTGDRVTCLVRPESFLIEPSGLPELRVYVDDVHFGGSVDFLNVRLGKTPLRASYVRRSGKRGVSTGPMMLGYNPDNVLVFAAK